MLEQTELEWLQKLTEEVGLAQRAQQQYLHFLYAKHRLGPQDKINIETGEISASESQIPRINGELEASENGEVSSGREVSSKELGTLSNQDSETIST